VFLGDIITQILESIAEGSYKDITKPKEHLSLGIEQLPSVLRDNTDRNRTSPFAFTGNKFEFRAVGASQSLGFPNAFLNAAVTESLQEVAQELRKHLEQGLELHAAILETIKEFYQEARPIVFNGNNYSPEWVEEAKKRGLPNIENTFDALQALRDPSNMELLESLGILKKHELLARYNVEIERLKRVIEIEANTLRYMVSKEIIPAALRFLSEIRPTQQGGLEAIVSTVSTLEGLVGKAVSQVGELDRLLAKMHDLGDETEEARLASFKIRPFLETMRETIDALELLVPSDYWPFPSYIDLLHSLR
jgi:glutamine synthetase